MLKYSTTTRKESMKITQTFSIKFSAEELDGLLTRVIQQEHPEFKVTDIVFKCVNEPFGISLESVSFRLRPLTEAEKQV